MVCVLGGGGGGARVVMQKVAKRMSNEMVQTITCTESLFSIDIMTAVSDCGGEIEEMASSMKNDLQSNK